MLKFLNCYRKQEYLGPLSVIAKNSLTVYLSSYKPFNIPSHFPADGKQVWRKPKQLAQGHRERCNRARAESRSADPEPDPQ